MRAAGEKLNREINPHFFNEEEFFARLAAKNHLPSNVVAKPKLFIKRDEHEFTGLVGRRLAPTA